MAAEDYFPIGDAFGDEYEGTANCRHCDVVCVWAEDRFGWRLLDYYTGERHVCTVDFPLDEAQ